MLMAPDLSWPGDPSVLVKVLESQTHVQIPTLPLIGHRTLDESVNLSTCHISSREDYHKVPGAG